MSASAHAQASACVSAHEAAQRARRDGKFLEAHKQLLQCAQSQCPRVVRNDCTTWANEVAASTPSLVWAVKGSRGEDLSAVRVLANGVQIADRLDGRAIEVDPGVYKLRFEADGYSAREETIAVREGEKTRLVHVQLDSSLAPEVVAAPVAPPAPAPQRGRVWSPASIALGSVAIASGAAALGIGLWGKGEYDDVRSRCGRAKSCSDADVETGRRAYIAADVLAGVAAATAVATVWVFVHDNRERATAVSAVPSRDGLHVSLTRAF
ncbi:MAG TPA: hypothetical protein VFX59_03240 [Polyangiales bacterium]|nr:hypothetical protein [Polyangiales bacterium]